MSRQFYNLGEFALHLATREIEVRSALEEGLEAVVKKIEATAKSEFGDYQPAVGPFQDWAELADATKEDRVRQGYSENDPLLRSGEVMNSVESEVDRARLEGGVGSPDEKMLWLETGTSKMPPRPVLGPAAYRNKSIIEKLVGAALVSGLIGKDQIHSALGYDFETGT